MNSEHSNLTLRSAFVWHFQSAKVFPVFLCVQYIVFDYHTFNLYGTGHTRNEEKKKHTKKEVAACVFTKWWCRNLLFFCNIQFQAVSNNRTTNCVHLLNKRIPKNTANQFTNNEDIYQNSNITITHLIWYLLSRRRNIQLIYQLI